jgi:hypothetical protein
VILVFFSFRVVRAQSGFSPVTGQSQFALVSFLSFHDLVDSFPEYFVEFGQSAAKARLVNGIQDITIEPY